MTRGISLWLDLLRVIATFVVVISHWAYPRFTGGDFIIIREWNLGSDAVIVFFVISGLVIAYAAERDGDGGTFVFNRLTRLWSVMLPALLLTLVFDSVGNRIDPSAYPGNFYQPHPIAEFLTRGLTFSNEFQLFDRLRLGTNGPLWSLSYEAAYYALFAAVVFLSGATRIAAIIAMIVVFGLPILLLLPAWLMGVFVWHALRDERFMPLAGALAWAMAVGAPLLYAAATVLGLPQVILAMTANALNVPDARLVLGFSDEFIWNNVIGLLTAVHILGMAAIMRDRARLRLPGIKWCAGASFSLYVTHYPALHLIDALLPQAMIGRYALLLAGSIAVGFVFAELFERTLGRVRAVLRGLHPAQT
ncbi:MAG: acyltransferase [Pseudomonadota bacterium]